MKKIPFFKAKAVPPGTIHVWSTGEVRKKVGKKWIPVSKEKTLSINIKTSSERYFDHALASSVGGIIEKTLNSAGIKSFEGLKKKVMQGSSDTAHELFKKVKDSVDKINVTPGEKQLAVDMIGKCLLKLRDYYSRSGKVALTIKKTPISGKAYYQKKEDKVLPILKPLQLKAAQKKTCGWTNMNKLPVSSSIKGMIKNKQAKLISGKIVSKVKWSLRGRAADIVVPWKSTEKGIKVKIKQLKSEGKKYATAFATVDVTVPYAYAKSFLLKHIKGDRTQRDLIGQLERSKGYIAFLSGGK